ncbi:unnamed protein product [Amoebophrya sp. A25]|nr:unnamed protein product [Amoebophrya sp. A25]|eukprot:GSA25T00014268001.1
MATRGSGVGSLTETFAANALNRKSKAVDFDLNNNAICPFDVAQQRSGGQGQQARQNGNVGSRKQSQLNKVSGRTNISAFAVRAATTEDHGDNQEENFEDQREGKTEQGATHSHASAEHGSDPGNSPGSASHERGYLHRKTRRRHSRRDRHKEENGTHESKRENGGHGAHLAKQPYDEAFASYLAKKHSLREFLLRNWREVKEAARTFDVVKLSMALSSWTPRGVLSPDELAHLIVFCIAQRLRTSDNSPSARALHSRKLTEKSLQLLDANQTGEFLFDLLMELRDGNVFIPLKKGVGMTNTQYDHHVSMMKHDEAVTKRRGKQMGAVCQACFRLLAKFSGEGIDKTVLDIWHRRALVMLHQSGIEVKMGSLSTTSPPRAEQPLSTFAGDEGKTIGSISSSASALASPRQDAFQEQNQGELGHDASGSPLSVGRIKVVDLTELNPGSTVQLSSPRTRPQQVHFSPRDRKKLRLTAPTHAPPRASSPVVDKQQMASRHPNFTISSGSRQEQDTGPISPVRISDQHSHYKDTGVLQAAHQHLPPATYYVNEFAAHSLRRKDLMTTRDVDIAAVMRLERDMPAAGKRVERRTENFLDDIAVKRGPGGCGPPGGMSYSQYGRYICGGEMEELMIGFEKEKVRNARRPG